MYEILFIHLRLLVVVWLSSHYGKGAINLLGKYGSHHLMGKSHF